jgi:hypothetical protein
MPQMALVPKASSLGRMVLALLLGKTEMEDGGGGCLKRWSDRQKSIGKRGSIRRLSSMEVEVDDIGFGLEEENIRMYAVNDEKWA